MNTIKKDPLIVIGGPTASGKSALGVELAIKIGGEIISADSMQIYRGMDIGSAKIREDEMKGVRHHLIDVADPDEAFSVARFKELSDEAIASIRSRGKIPIMVGGSGFYIQAVIKDVNFAQDEIDQEYRDSLSLIAEEDRGEEKLHEMLRAVDPESARLIHMNNKKRVMRALEFYHSTGRKISEHNVSEAAKESSYDLAYFVLGMDRARLYERIERRVDAMIEAGLTSEVRALLDKGYGSDLVSMQGLGYKELVPYIDGEMSLDDAVSILKRNSRRYAKRQVTWFKREQDAVWIDSEKYSSAEEIINMICGCLRYRNII